MGGPTGNGATEAATVSYSARGPALALIDSRGHVVRLTESFRTNFAPDAPPPLSIWDLLGDPDQRVRLGRVLEGALVSADLELPSASGSVTAHAQAVLDAAVMRHVLLTVASAGSTPEPCSGAEVLLCDPSLHDSPAIVWIKDLGGRYLRVNRRYSERLGIDEAGIRGRTDDELSSAQVIPEPHMIGHHGPGIEPAQLEYTVAAAYGRDALTVLRFPLHDLKGAAVAVCGVAAPVAEAERARSEAVRLLRLERWAGLSAAAIRAELLEEWQIAEFAAADAPPPTMPVTGADPERGSGSQRGSDPPASHDDAALERLRAEIRAAHSAVAELEKTVTEERAAKAELEARLAAESTRAQGLTVEVAENRTRAQTADRDLALARLRADELERAQADAATATERAGEQISAEQSVRAELERRVAEAQRRAEEAERVLAAEQARAAHDREELLARAERTEAETAAIRAAGERAAGAVKRADAAAELARGRAEGLEVALAEARQAADRSRVELERARTENAQAQTELAQARTELAQAQSELAQARTELAQAQSELAQARTDNARLQAEIASFRRALEKVREDNEAREAGRLATEQAERARHQAAAETAQSAPHPSWSHQAQRALSASLLEATEWRATLKEAVRILGREGGWDAVVAWCPEERRNSLRCVAMWMAAPDQHALFETATWQRRESPTGSEIGRAAAGELPRWISDLARIDDPRLVAAARDGMRAALLVPIRSAGETGTVLELLTENPAELDRGTVSALEAVGLQLAQFEYLLRLAAEPRWRMGRL